MTTASSRLRWLRFVTHMEVQWVVTRTYKKALASGTEHTINCACLKPGRKPLIGHVTSGRMPVRVALVLAIAEMQRRNSR